MKKPAFEVELCGYDTIRQIPLHSLPMHSSVPAYLRFKTVYIHAPDLFKNSRRILAALKHLQSAFVGCMLVFSSGFYKPFTTRHSFLSFLKLQLLPLFPECEEYKFCGPNMRINDLNEFEQEQLLLLPEFYNSLGSIELSFVFGDPFGDVCYSDRVSPIISIPEIFATATQSRSYRLEVKFHRHVVIGREIFLNEDFTAINHNTGEQLTIFYRGQYPDDEEVFSYPIEVDKEMSSLPLYLKDWFPGRDFVGFQRNKLPNVSL
ncbi:hypothetical protein Ddc_10317 [Ditylenchus destructor]|nr:hypothetical protein Ddc_10317 [Ditylenchus destructor]